jgi:hypothetical protein
VPVATPTEPPAPTAVIAATHTPTRTPNPPSPVVMLRINEEGRFGFMTIQGDPANPDDDNKPLTYNDPGKLPNGNTNNTRVWVDGKTPSFGEAPIPFLSAPVLASDNASTSAVWEYDNIVFTQTVKVELSTTTHRFDTFRIEYAAQNRDTISHTVGVRVLLDTLIGNNDGVPFVVPGRPGVITTPLDLRGNDIPNFIQALEKPDPSNPGVIVQLTLAGGVATLPDRVLISPWCHRTDFPWEYADKVGVAQQNLYQCGQPRKTDGSPNKLDSAVGIFFDAKPLNPGETRRWTTFYGLGGITRPPEPTSQLSLSSPPQRVQVGDKFYLTALVKNPKAGQRVKITVPPELQLLPGRDPEQAVTQTNVEYTQVSWFLQAVQAKDNLSISVALGNETVSTRIDISPAPTPTPTIRPITPTPCATSVLVPQCP